MNRFYKYILIFGAVLFAMAVLPAAHADPPEGPPLEMPPKEILGRITHDAMRGYFAGIEKIIEEITTDYPVFCRSLLRYTDLFDSDGIIDFVNSKGEVADG